MQTKASTTGSQLALRVILLLGILLGCLAWAWWGFVAQNHATREGAAILDTIHRKTLPALWSDKPIERWMLIHDNGQPIGYSMERRQRTSDGYAGQFAQVLYTAGKPALKRESHWRLNEHASAGRYNAIGLLLRPGAKPVLMDMTTIQQVRGELSVQQQRLGPKGQKAISRAPVPVNYAPEGVLPILVAEVAKRKNEARFKMVFDEHLPESSNQVAFGQIHIRYLGESKTSPGGAEVSLLFAPPGNNRPQKQTWTLNADSLVVEIVAGTQRTTLASRDEVFETLGVKSPAAKTESP
jgi:hypothetical protein